MIYEALLSGNVRYALSEKKCPRAPITPLSAPLFIIDEPARVYAESDQTFFNLDDFKCATPPYPMFALEWVVPKQWNLGPEYEKSENYQQVKQLEGIEQVTIHEGLLFSTIESEIERVLPMLLENRILEDAKKVVSRFRTGGGRWFALARGYTSFDDYVCDLGLALVFGIRPDGTAFGLNEKGGVILALDPTFHGTPSLDDPTIHHFSGSMLHISLLGLSFVNIKNSSVIKREHSRQVRRYNEKHNLPNFSWHEVRIPTQPARQHTAEETSQDAPSRRLHLCRGHFSTYTSEAPLFGKHTGTFWVPSHSRGDASKGLILKSYNVKSL